MSARQWIQHHIIKCIHQESSVESRKDDHQLPNKIVLYSQHFSPNKTSQSTFIQEGPFPKQEIAFRLGKTTPTSPPRDISSGELAHRTWEDSLPRAAVMESEQQSRAQFRDHDGAQCSAVRRARPAPADDYGRASHKNKLLILFAVKVGRLFTEQVFQVEMKTSITHGCGCSWWADLLSRSVSVVSIRTITSPRSGASWISNASV